MHLAISAPYRDLVEDTTNIRCVETAHLDCRRLPTALAITLALSSPLRIGALIVPTAQVERALHHARRWDSKLKIRRAGNSVELIGYHTWIAASVDEIPADLSYVNVAEAHEFATAPKLLYNSVVFGAISDRGHWFYELCRKSTTIQIDSEITTKTWPDQIPYVIDDSRRMRLIDEPPRRLPLHMFAVRRLRIRTDRPRHELSELQQAAHDAQPGAARALVPLEVSGLQRRYLAQKRLLKAKGFRKFLVLKYRRGGITAIEQAALYEEAATRASARCTLIAHTEESTRTLFNVALDYSLNDPLSPGIARNNMSEIELTNGSKILINTAGSRNVARGEALNKVHGSEVARWLEGRSDFVVEQMLAGLTEAAVNGEVTLESTANGSSGWWYSTCLEASNNIGDFALIFLPWFLDKRHTIEATVIEDLELLANLNDREKWLVQNHGLTASQIRWRRNKNSQRAMRRLFLQEYPETVEEAFLAASLLYFPSDLVMELEDDAKNFPPELEQDGVRFYQLPKKNKKYVAGMDCSEGVPGGDFTYVFVMDFETGEQVASLHGRFKAKEAAYRAVKLCRKFNYALLGVERNNHGHEVLAQISSLGYDALWAHVRRRVGGKRERIVGWDTNEATRNVLLDDFRKAIDDGYCVPRDLLVMKEMRSFEQPDGALRAEARPGTHDDSIFAGAIAWQVRCKPNVEPGVIVI